MSQLRITAGPFAFQTRFETQGAPKTCEIFSKLLPYSQRVIHVRWSGEAVWIPLGDLDMGVPGENQTSFPALGQMLLYPGGSARRNPARLWRRSLLKQGGSARRQSFHHRDLADGGLGEARQAVPVGRCAAAPH